MGARALLSSVLPPMGLAACPVVQARACAACGRLSSQPLLEHILLPATGNALLQTSTKVAGRNCLHGPLAAMEVTWQVTLSILTDMAPHPLLTYNTVLLHLTEQVWEKQPSSVDHKPTALKTIRGHGTAHSEGGPSRPTSLQSWSSPCQPSCPPHLELLEQALDDVQQDVPGHGLELPPVLLDESGYGEDNLVGHHLIRTGHGLEYRARGSQLLLALAKEARARSPPSEPSLRPLLPHVSRATETASQEPGSMCSTLAPKGLMEPDRSLQILGPNSLAS